MKKLLLALIAIVSACTLHAQDYTGKLIDSTFTAGGALTSTTNIGGVKHNITFGYDVAKNSGTVAGAILLQGKVHASSGWITLNTYNLTDASVSTSVVLTANNYVAYRVLVNATTGNANYKVWLLYRELRFNYQ